MKTYTSIILTTLFLMMQSCQFLDSDLTDTQKNEITEAASEVVKKIFNSSNNLDFVGGLEHYSETANSYFITDGKIHSFDDLRKEYSEVGPYVEALKNNIESWNTKVLSKDIVLFTLPIQLTLKLKDIPEYTGNLIWTATVQKQNDQWMIVQSHESWLNCAEVAKALTPES